MQNILTYLSENHEVLLAIITGVISVSSLIASLTPTPKDDSFVGKLYKLVDLLALNIGKAKDKG